MAAIILLMGVLVLAFAGVIGAVVDDPPRKPSTTTVPTVASTSSTLVPLAEFGDAGEEMQALIDNSRSITFHTVYTVSDPALPEGLVQTLETWRDGNRYRSDIVERDGDTVRRQSSLVGASSAVYCETVSGEETCRVLTQAPRDLVQEFVRLLGEQDPRPRLRVSDGDVAGYIARCFTFEGDTDKDDGELCLAEDGLMLSVRLLEANVVATTVEDVVPDSAFAKPGFSG